MRVVLGLAAIVVGVGALASLTREDPVRTLGEFSTPLSGRDSNQRHNAELCSGRIDGAVIQPGETFSFNQTVGPWSRDRGYRRAPVSYSGQMIDAWGGGVCQTSSTIYNAALLAGLGIDERSPHHFAPTYVEPGRDAAVAYPNIDLKVTNPYDVPLVLHVKVEGGRIRVWFTGQVQEVLEVEVSTRIVSAFRPQNIEVGKGARRVVRNVGKPGFEVESYRRVGDSRELLAHDRYEVMNRVVEHSFAQ